MSPRTPRGAERPTYVVRSTVSGTSVAVDAFSVESITDLRTIERQGGTVPLDIAQVLGLPEPEGAAGDRRVLLILTSGGLRAVVVGHKTRIEELRGAALRPLPPFLSEITARAGIVGITLTSAGDDEAAQTLGFVLDVDRISERARAGEGT